MLNFKNQTVQFDCAAGAAGDMLLGAMLSLLESLDAGEIATWHAAMAPLLATESHGRCEVKQTVRAGKPCVKVDFFVGDVHADHHPHPSNGKKHDLHHHHHDHRSFRDIRSLFMRLESDGALAPAPAELAIRIFTTLAIAEAAAHETDLESVQFHEVGAFDSVMDIAGFALAFTRLAPIAVECTPVTLGTGRVHTSHGILTVPTPAVREIVERFGLPPSSRHLPGECCTPTGAAILGTIVTRWLADEKPRENTFTPPISLIGEGCGAGTRDPEYPNVVVVSLTQR